MAILRCEKCQTPLPGAVVNTGAPVACPACGVALVVQVFPALLRPPPRGRPAEPLASAEDAGCFYHPLKKAAVPCEECGRFLCALCDLEIDGRHVCPACVEAARQAGRPLLMAPRTLHDRVALNLLLAGMVVAGVVAAVAASLSGSVARFILAAATLVLALVTLSMVVFYWNEPLRGPVPRRRTRLVLAAGLVALQIAGWVFFLYGDLHRHAHVL